MQLSPIHQAPAHALLERACERYGATSMKRMAEMLEIACGRRAAHPPADERQSQSPMTVPGLSATPWHEAHALRIARELEQSWEAIREELFGALGRKAGFQHFVSMDPASATDTPKEWKALYLRNGGIDLTENRQLCPQTAYLIGSKQVNGLVMFSALDPGGHVPPHQAGWNAMLNLHLGLSIPPDCGLRVAGTTKIWQEGRCLLFDECFMHESWNNGPRTRFILLVNVWHPELTEPEIEFLDILTDFLDAGETTPHALARRNGRHELAGQQWWT